MSGGWWTVGAVASALICVGCAVLVVALCRAAAKADASMNDVFEKDLDELFRVAVDQPASGLTADEIAILARYEIDFRRPNR